ncbi:hypothetical protein EDD86DRAFT_210668 [Gorgonomyces haynaldii]|nr:hypothetical protein EDD86DRAFT_210668 [Gorgonomyces haynaldii]
MEDHPGGGEILLQYGGKDITEVMQDPMEHLHSDSAYDMLDAYCIGRLTDAKMQEPETKKVKFIDPSKPMLMQILKGNFTKAFYMHHVHIPTHVPYSAPLFGPFYLEMFSLTPWYVIPMFWTPIISYCIGQALKTLSWSELAPWFVLGVFNWTFIEYAIHRFLFHVDDLLPEHPVALMIHFLLHGVHHYLPMDKMRLVMPPALGFTLAYPIWMLYCFLAPNGHGQAAIAGSMLGFVLYDLTHYYTHHGKPSITYFKEVKSYHLDHHYKEPNLGFGITSRLWDRVFNTLLY